MEDIKKNYEQITTALTLLLAGTTMNDENEGEKERREKKKLG